MTLFILLEALSFFLAYAMAKYEENWMAKNMTPEEIEEFNNSFVCDP